MSATSIEAATSSHLLDNPAWAALAGPHSLSHSLKGMGGTPIAERVGRAARYPLDVAPFCALSDPDDPQTWADPAALVGPGGTASVRGVTAAPDGWEIVRTGHCVQLVDTALRAEPDPEAVRLGPADVPEILDLVARTLAGSPGRNSVTVRLFLAKAIDRTEVRHVARALRPRVLNPRRRVRLHSRPHIDLQRVAGALCCS